MRMKQIKCGYNLNLVALLNENRQATIKNTLGVL